LHDLVAGKVCLSNCLSILLHQQGVITVWHRLKLIFSHNTDEFVSQNLEAPFIN